MTSRPAPWELQGEAVLTSARGLQPHSHGYPPGVSALPGPSVVTAARFDDSPVGPYLELAVAGPARVGLRPGLCVTTMVVDSHESRLEGRLNWGFPKELGGLRWSSEGEGRSLVWEEREVALRALPSGRTFALALPLVTLQRREGALVAVRGWVRGRARSARVHIEAPPDDPLAGLAGPHWGIVVDGLRLVVEPAKALSVPSTAGGRRNRVGVAEPALSSDPD